MARKKDAIEYKKESKPKKAYRAYLTKFRERDNCDGLNIFRQLNNDTENTYSILKPKLPIEVVDQEIDTDLMVEAVKYCKSKK